MTCCDTAAINVFIQARLLMPDGRIIPNNWQIQTAVTKAASYQLIVLPECFILSLAITAQQNANARNVFCSAIISRGIPTAGSVSTVLCQGYVTRNMPLSWPPGVNTNQLDTAGNLKVIIGTVPAPGQEINESVPQFTKWRLMAVNFSLTTSAAAGSRIMTFVMGTNAIDYCFLQSPAAQAISLTWNYQLASNIATLTGTNGVIQMSAFAGIFLNALGKFRTITTAIQAADQYTAPTYYFEEWCLP
jgi:hypothetical protein